MRAFPVFIIVFFSLHLSAQINLKALELKPKAGLKIKLTDMQGANGSAVAWVDEFKKYYTVVAGNEEYAIEVFNEKGEHLQTIITGADVRGMWFNPDYKLLEANTYDYQDIISYDFVEEGLLLDDIPITEIYELPVSNPQAALCLNTKDKVYAWLANGEELVFLETENGDETGSLMLTLPAAKEKINATTVAYTGIPGGEYALLNFTDKVVYLISGVTGKVAATVTLPKDAVTNGTFCFSFSNGHIWLFDTASRAWTGYKIVK